METNYYEVYNQDNVDLIDLAEVPIERVTPKGVQTAIGEIELDLLILATGFDAVRGALDRIEIRSGQGVTLKERWADGPVTYLGLAAAGFPNLLTLVGPHNSATFCNIPRCIEQNVDWVTDLIHYMKANGYNRIEATPEAEQEWTDHVFDVAQGLLLTKTRSWFMGLNSNIEGRDKPRLLVYAGGAPRYRQRCDEVAAQGYAGFTFD
jgi:cation diffusion facilitator CzcD-associated flavoprotein CzcO